MSTPVRTRSDNDNAELVSPCPRRLLESGDATSGSACRGTESRDGDAEEYNVQCLCTVEAPSYTSAVDTHSITRRRYCYTTPTS